jgi:hypothetical protein
MAKKCWSLYLYHCRVVSLLMGWCVHGGWATKDFPFSLFSLSPNLKICIALTSVLLFLHVNYSSHCFNCFLFVLIFFYFSLQFHPLIKLKFVLPFYFYFNYSLHSFNCYKEFILCFNFDPYFLIAIFSWILLYNWFFFQFYSLIFD